MTTTARIVLVVAVLVAGCGESGPMNNNFGGAGGTMPPSGGSTGSTGGAAVGTGGSNPSGTGGGTVQPGTGGSSTGTGGMTTATGTGGNSGTGAVTGTGGTSTTGTGGKPAMIGGNTGTGNNTGTGGYKPGHTGGSTGTGGAPMGTGGAMPGTGGATPGTGGKPAMTGGVSGTGGMIATTGGSTGTGGMIAGTGGAPMGTGGAMPGTGGAPMMTPFNCTNFGMEFSVSGRVWDIASFGANNTYAAVSTSNTGLIVHWNGSSATDMLLPVASGHRVYSVLTVWGVSANDVWAGATIMPEDVNGQPIGIPRSVLYRRLNGGAWQEDGSLTLASSENEVSSVTGWDANNVFVLTHVGGLPGTDDAKIYRKIGGSWTTMGLPAHSPPTRMVKLVAIGAQLYAVGSRLDSDPISPDSIQGILWKFDGSAWSNIATLPSDVVQLTDVSGADGAVIVSGRGKVGGIYKGIRLVSSNLATWSRNESLETYTEGTVWMPRIGAALSAGTMFTSSEGRIAVMSQNSWMAMGPGLPGARVTRPVSGTSRVLIGIEGGVANATCQ